MLIAPEFLDTLTPSTAEDGIDTLRKRFKADGYLWLQGLLPKQRVHDFRAWVFKHLAPSGLLEQGTEFTDGIAFIGRYDKTLATQRMMSMVRSASFEGFCTQAPLTQFMEAFLEGLPYLHQRKLMRYVRPGSPDWTPAHYDQVYLRAGSDQFVTSWIPIGDVALDQGGLVYLRGSQKIGQRLESEYLEKAVDLPVEQRVSAFNKYMNTGGHITSDLSALAKQNNSQWLGAKVEAGDIFLHSPYMVHGSTTNRHVDNKIRLSIDIRFQNLEKSIDQRWANHWRLDDGL